MCKSSFKCYVITNGGMTEIEWKVKVSNIKNQPFDYMWLIINVCK